MELQLDEQLLDDADALAAADPASMLRTVAGSGAQVREAATSASEAGVESLGDERPRAVILSAVGSSAASCEVLRALIADDVPLPLIEVSGPADRPVLPAGVETAAYRIAVEAMTNAARHSGGSHCTVTITVADGRVEVAVVDDGAGLPGLRRAGVGLRSMSERAAELGGTCEVGSPDGAGTAVRALLPLGTPA